MALLALGIATAVVRRPALLQVLGFLVAENGIYLPRLSAAGRAAGVHRARPGVRPRGDRRPSPPPSARKIHDELGTGDTSLLGALRD